MDFPERLLGEGEEVVLHLRSHWKALVLPSLVLVVAVGCAGFLAAVTPAGEAQPWVRLGIVVAAALVVLRWSVRPYLVWLTSTFTLTTERLVVRGGVLSRHGRDMPLARVNDVQFSHSFVERLLGCGTITVESAGERGQLVLTDVPRVELVQRELYRLVDAENDRQRLGGRGEAGT